MEESKWGLKFTEVLFLVLARNKNQNKTEHSLQMHFCRCYDLALLLAPVLANSGCIMGNSAFTGVQLLSQKMEFELLSAVKKLLSPHTMLWLYWELLGWLKQLWRLERSDNKIPKEKVVFKQILLWILQMY